MKMFILKSIVLFSGFAAMCGLNCVLNTIIINEAELPLIKRQVLIAGDSHPQFAVNPDVFYSAENIAQSGEPYTLTFWKLKYIFKYYRPDILILGFSHHNISAFNDYKFIDDKWSGELFRRSYYIGEFESLQNDIEIDYRGYYGTYFREMMLFPHPDHFTFIGRFRPRDKNDLSDIQSTIRRHYFLGEKVLPVSEHSVVYLDSIVDLCLKNKVKPVLVGSPVHRDYYKKIPAHILNRYESEKGRLSKAGISVLDLTNEYFDDSYFYDEDHLNVDGAFIFTHKIIPLLPKEREPMRLIKATTDKVPVGKVENDLER